MRYAFALLLLIAMSCVGASDQRDGSSFARAIIVPPGHPDEVRWEMVQAHRVHPDVNLGDAMQYLVPHKGRVYDVYEFHTSRGKKITMFFDIGPEKP